MHETQYHNNVPTPNAPSPLPMPIPIFPCVCSPPLGSVEGSTELNPPVFVVLDELKDKVVAVGASVTCVRMTVLIPPLLVASEVELV